MFARSRPYLRLLLITCTAIAALAMPTVAHAATATWDGDTDTSWTTAGNWSTGAVPLPADDVVIPAANADASSVVIVGIPTSTIDSLTVQDAPLNAPQSLTGLPNAQLTVIDTLSVTGGSFTSIGFALPATVQSAVLADSSSDVLSLDAGTSATTVAAGVTLELANASALRFNVLSVADGGRLRVSGDPQIDASFSVLNGAALQMDDGSTITFEGGSMAGTSVSVSGSGLSTVNLHGYTFEESVDFGDVGVNISDAPTALYAGKTLRFGGFVNLDSLLRLYVGSTVHVESTSNVSIWVDADPVGIQEIGAASILNEGGITFEARPTLTTGSGRLEADVTSTGPNAGMSFIGTFPVSTGGHGITSNGGDMSFESGSPTLTAGPISITDSSGSNPAFLIGTGTINAAVTVGAGGVVVPDRAVAPSLTFSNLTMSSGSHLQIYLDSPTAYGRIAADGTTDGEITVSPFGGYVPAVGATFVVRTTVTGGATADTFATVDSRQLGSGKWMTQTAAGTQLTLTTKQATLLVSSGGYPGGEITLTGSGYAPGEAVPIDIFGDTAGYASARPTADGTGAYSVVVPVSTTFTSDGLRAYSYGAVSQVNVIGVGVLGTAPTCAAGQTGTPPNCVTPTTTVTYIVTPGNDIVHAGNGDDLIRALAGDDAVGGAGGNDVIDGQAGNDALFGGLGDDVLYGGFGNDRAFGGAGNDRLGGGPGADVLYGQAGNDVIAGGLGNDVLSGGPGRDVLRGGAGNDVLACGTGADKAYGDAGNDLIGCIDGMRSDIIAGGTGRDLCIGDRGDTFVGCERIFRK